MGALVKTGEARRRCQIARRYAYSITKPQSSPTHSRYAEIWRSVSLPPEVKAGLESEHEARRYVPFTLDPYRTANGQWKDNQAMIDACLTLRPLILILLQRGYRMIGRTRTYLAQLNREKRRNEDAEKLAFSAEDEDAEKLAFSAENEVDEKLAFSAEDEVPEKLASRAEDEDAVRLASRAKDEDAVRLAFSAEVFLRYGSSLLKETRQALAMVSA